MLSRPRQAYVGYSAYCLQSELNLTSLYIVISKAKRDQLQQFPDIIKNKPLALNKISMYIYLQMHSSLLKLLF